MRTVFFFVFICLLFVSNSATANEITDAVLYNQIQQNQEIARLRQQLNQQNNPTRPNEQMCREIAQAAMMAPKHTGASLLEGFGQQQQAYANCMAGKY